MPDAPLSRTQKITAWALSALILAALVPVIAWSLHALWVWGFGWVG